MFSCIAIITNHMIQLNYIKYDDYRLLTKRIDMA